MAYERAPLRAPRATTSTGRHLSPAASSPSDLAGHQRPQAARGRTVADRYEGREGVVVLLIRRFLIRRRILLPPHRRLLRAGTAKPVPHTCKARRIEAFTTLAAVHQLATAHGASERRARTHAKAEQHRRRRRHRCRYARRAGRGRGAGRGGCGEGGGLSPRHGSQEQEAEDAGEDPAAEVEDLAHRQVAGPVLGVEGHIELPHTTDQQSAISNQQSAISNQRSYRVEWRVELCHARPGGANAPHMS